ncbi:hypothetical protein V2G26_020847 [Clonostachys chloroleuca]
MDRGGMAWLRSWCSTHDNRKEMRKPDSKHGSPEWWSGKGVALHSPTRYNLQARGIVALDMDAEWRRRERQRHEGIDALIWRATPVQYHKPRQELPDSLPGLYFEVGRSTCSLDSCTASWIRPCLPQSG